MSSFHEVNIYSSSFTHLSNTKENRPPLPPADLIFVRFIQFDLKLCLGNMTLFFDIFQVTGGQCFDIWPSDALQSGVGVLVVFISFLIPLIILIYCYGMILWVLWKRIDSNLDKGGMSQSSAKFQTAQKNVIKTLFIVVLFLVFCFSYSEVFYLLYHLGYSMDFNGFHYKFSTVLFFFNCTVNPFIYLVNYRDFQEGLKLLLCKRKPEVRNSDVTATTSTWQKHFRRISLF